MTGTNPTVLAVGGATLSTAGGVTGDDLAAAQVALDLASFSGKLSVTTVAGGAVNPTLPAAPTTPGETDVLVVPANDSGTIGVPSGYGDVIYTGAGTLTGGGAGQLIAGDLNYRGAAGTVLATGGAGSVSDSASNAVLAFFAGIYAADASGNAARLSFDNAVNFFATVSGSLSTALIGTPSTAGGGLAVTQQPSQNFLTMTGSNDVASVLSGTNFILTGASPETIDVAGGWTQMQFGGGQVTIDQTAGTVLGTLVAGGTLVVNGGGGRTTFWDAAGGTSAQLGAASEFVAGAGSDTAAASAGGTDTVWAAGGAMHLFGSNQAGSRLLFAGVAGASSVSGGAAATVYGLGGSGVYTAGAAFEYVGYGSADTIFAGAGSNDTVFAEFGALDYSGQGAQTLTFAGGAGAASVAAPDTATVYGGSGSLAVTAGGASFTFIGMSGKDTITQGFGSGETWSGSNEHLTLTSVGSAGAFGSQVIAYGTNDTIDATNSNGSNSFLMLNQAGFTGNATILGATAGNDLFTLYVDTTKPPAHTITIENWQPSDVFVAANLSYGADGPLSNADANTVNAFAAGQLGNSFTLTDGTKVVFAGAQPTAILHF